MFRTLHLSDIHIGKTYKDSESIAYQIISDLRHNDLIDVDCIAVTGDVFEGTLGYDNALIDEAVRFFEILLSGINNRRQVKELTKLDILFVPGNHDLIRDENETEKWKKYREFLYKFYGELPSIYDPHSFSFIKPYSDRKIVFVGFNSCQIEKKPQFDDAFIRRFKTEINKDDLSIRVQKLKR